MAGRNGNDQLNTFLLVITMALLVLGSIFTKRLGAVLYPLMFVILLVGVQGLIEAVTCGVVGTVICKALHAAFGFRHAAVKV